MGKQGGERADRFDHRLPGTARGHRKKLTALLDVQLGGVEYEGEDPPRTTPADNLAIRAWNLLRNGHGGMDWSGLPMVCAHLGIEDIEGLLDRLEVIRNHKPPEDTAEPEED
ncbi:MAG: hypothetical protein K2Q07_01355 [Burkholderiaceae bacterium]|nr:hypothetical protein [Burkholderiaceae bacterium]